MLEGVFDGGVVGRSGVADLAAYCILSMACDELGPSSGPLFLMGLFMVWLVKKELFTDLGEILLQSAFP